MITIPGNLWCGGRGTFKSLDIPAGAVDNAAVKAAAGIEAEKLEHRHQVTFMPAASNTVASAGTYALHAVYGTAGRIVSFAAGLISPCAGDATVTVDLHKNGVTALSSTFDIDSGDAARALVAGTIDPAKVTLAAGDVLEVVITVSAGTGTLGDGFFCRLVVNEDAA